MAARRNAAPKPEETPVEATPFHPEPSAEVAPEPVPAEETPVESVVVTTEQFEAEPEAKPVPEGYAVLVGPSGIPSTVPVSIVEALLDSGYKRK